MRQMAETPTKMKLAKVLREQGLTALADRAEKGEFDDYESPHALPQHVLVSALMDIDRTDLIKRVMDGEWDGTKEEADAWMEREGKDFLLGGSSDGATR
jgi:hypothetical protein